jgi:hypothetical protein
MVPGYKDITPGNIMNFTSNPKQNETSGEIKTQSTKKIADNFLHYTNYISLPKYYTGTIFYSFIITLVSLLPFVKNIQDKTMILRLFRYKLPLAAAKDSGSLQFLFPITGVVLRSRQGILSTI